MRMLIRKCSSHAEQDELHKVLAQLHPDHMCNWTVIDNKASCMVAVLAGQPFRLT